MDRSMYGKIDPGARQPYRCTVREGGILPGCKFSRTFIRQKTKRISRTLKFLIC